MINVTISSTDDQLRPETVNALDFMCERGLLNVHSGVLLERGQCMQNGDLFDHDQRILFEVPDDQAPVFSSRVENIAGGSFVFCQACDYRLVALLSEDFRLP